MQETPLAESNKYCLRAGEQQCRVPADTRYQQPHTKTLHIRVVVEITQAWWGARYCLSVFVSPRVRSELFTLTRGSTLAHLEESEEPFYVGPEHSACERLIPHLPALGRSKIVGSPVSLHLPPSSTPTPPPPVRLLSSAFFPLDKVRVLF